MAPTPNQMKRKLNKSNNSVDSPKNIGQGKLPAFTSPPKKMKLGMPANGFSPKKQKQNQKKPVMMPVAQDSDDEDSDDDSDLESEDENPSGKLVAAKGGFEGEDSDDSEEGDSDEGVEGEEDSEDDSDGGNEVPVGGVDDDSEDEDEDDDDDEDEDDDDDEDRGKPLEIPTKMKEKKTDEMREKKKSKGEKDSHTNEAMQDRKQGEPKSKPLDRSLKKFVLIVRNIPYSAREEELQEHFSSVGSIKSIYIPLCKETGRSKGFAMIEVEDAVSFVKGLYLHNTEMSGRNISVDFTINGEVRQAGGPQGGGAFRGGRGGFTPRGGRGFSPRGGWGGQSGGNRGFSRGRGGDRGRGFGNRGGRGRGGD